MKVKSEVKKLKKGVEVTVKIINRLSIISRLLFCEKFYLNSMDMVSMGNVV